MFGTPSYKSEITPIIAYITRIGHHILIKPVGNMSDRYKHLYLKIKLAKKNLHVTNLDNSLNINMLYVKFIPIKCP